MRFSSGDAELLGGDLRQRGEDALPELDLAARDRHRAVALEAHALRQASSSDIAGGVSATRRLHHAVVRAAAAQVPVQRLAHLAFGGDSYSAKEARPRSRRCRSCSSRTARPARRAARFCTGCSPPRRGPSTVVTFLPTTKDSGRSHEAIGAAVDQHEAGAALAAAAAEAGADEAEVVAQHVEQRRVGRRVDFATHAVDFNVSRMAVHTRAGEYGKSRWWMPSGRSASSTAFATAGTAPMVPASPAPLTPSGLVGEGTGWSYSSIARLVVGARHGVVHEAAGEELARCRVVHARARRAPGRCPARCRRAAGPRAACGS